jgi:DNA-binding CsgD family transcriptional regulator
MMVVRQHDFLTRDVILVSSIYLDFSRSFAGLHYALQHSRRQRGDWDYLSRQPEHMLIPDTEIGPTAEELDARGDYAFLRKRLGVRRRLGVRLNSDRVWFDGMSIAFDDAQQQIPLAALSKTQPLLAHLTKSAEIGRTFHRLRARYSAALSALDRVSVGLAIALPSGEIITDNAEARRICDLRDGLTKTLDGRLNGATPEQTAELQEHIRRVANTAKAEDTCAEWLMAIPRRSTSEPVLVDIAPLKDSSGEIDAVLEGALITLIDPDNVPDLRIGRFAKLYGLTKAEAEVCELLLKGAATEEIAERRSVTPVTAKNQINAILGKTGVNRRSDLIRLALRVLPPVT